MQPIKMACALGNLNYNFVSYECIKNEDGWTSEWYNVKNKLGLDLPNLPYLIEVDGSGFTESQAILTYVCEKGGLTTDYDQVQRAQALAFSLEVQDIRNNAVKLFYNTWDGNWGEEGACGKYYDSAKKKFNRLEKIIHVNDNGNIYLVKNAPGFCGADIHLAEMIYQHMLLLPEILADCPTLKKFASNFFAQDRIAALEAESAESKLAINNKMAHWGNEYMEAPQF